MSRRQELSQALGQSRHYRPLWLGLGVLASLIGTFACGGGGGTGGTDGGMPVAPDPVCNDSIPQTASPAAVNLGAHVIVPPSSVARVEDAGIRAHTNFVISTRVAASRLPDPASFAPPQIRKAYGVVGNGSGAIAVVDALNFPTALHDFNHFSTQYGLPVETSSVVTASSNTVFQVVYANGSKPADDAGWSQEMALDTEWAHGMAPGAKIYLVEAASANLSDLMDAVSVAKTLPGVKQVSMSFGTVESGCSFALYDSDMLRSGVTFFAASGDNGGHRDFPGESNKAVSVGATNLKLNVDDTWQSETPWTGMACGASAFEPRPPFQNVVFSFVGKFRGACDIVAVGDPATGVNVYDSFATGGTGWLVFGGTSVSCPIIAGIANTSGASHPNSQSQNATLYANLGSANFHDIATGSASGHSAAAGWDFASGVGSPNGVGGF